jgi:peptide-methionine (S)-S-oxide reductase
MKSRLFVALAAVFGMLTALPACAAEQAFVIPAPEVDNPKVAGTEQKAVLAGGCFWGVQGVFQHLGGVKRVLSGYAGGEKGTAHYEVVSRGDTGHAESVEIVFDPKEVSYGEILQVFFSVAHDPTQLNRQGPDSGTQYRSSIFYADEQQKKIATAYIAQLDKTKVYPSAIVTRVDALKGFYPAEGYHQDYLVNNPKQPYIVFNDLPKVRNFQKTLPTLWHGTPVLVSDNR